MTKKVLLVDDVSMFIELEKDYLQHSAVSVMTARDGQQALAVCQKERPGLVFMDLHMPVMNGAECCKAIKQDRQLEGTKVVLITSEGKESDRLLCLNAGCDDFMTKPLDRQIFLDTARRLLPAIDRREIRVSCRLNVKYRVFGVTLSGYIANLSQSGAYIVTGSEVAKDAEVDLIFALPEPGSLIIQTKARVAWLNSKKTRRKPSLAEGFGVEFVALPDEAARKIGRFIESENPFI